MSLAIDLTNYRILVTGASSGVGLGMAQALFAAGADVAGCGLEADTKDGVRAFFQSAQAHGRRAFYLQTDVAEANAARQCVAWAASQLGGLDCAVSNAGRNFFKGAAHTTEADWQANAELNLAAHWRMAQAAKPFLDQAPQPVILITTSNHAYYTMRDCFPYNVAKAGLTAMVQSLAIEWGPHIRAVGIAPGFIHTPLAEAWFNEFPDPAAKHAAITALHPVGRIGTPADVGALCAFLCSPLAGYISGNTILIDGGRNAVMQDG